MLALCAGHAHAQLITEPPTSWEVEEFDDGNQSHSSNPQGVWSYGSESTLGMNFQPLTLLIQPNIYNPYLEYSGWISADNTLQIGHNSTIYPWDQLQYGYPYPVTLPPRGVLLAPGAGCEYAVIRFKAPYAGRYKINGQFDGLDGQSVGGLEQNVKVYMLVNNNASSPLYSASIHTVAGLKTASFTPSTTSTLAAGGTIDFVVGCGPGNDYWFGATSLRAVVQWTGKKHP